MNREGLNSNSIKNPKVSVITLTRGRLNLLKRALDSVAHQDFEYLIEHVVVVDDDVDTFNYLNKVRYQMRQNITIVFVGRSFSEAENSSSSFLSSRAYVYPRLSLLFNIGVQVASAEKISFLDDDNEYCPNHISSLFSMAQEKQLQAVHSGRLVMNENGSPYLEERFPGVSDANKSKEIFAKMCDKGIWVKGTNILMDHTSTKVSNFNNSTKSSEFDEVFLVDQNVWLLDRKLLLKFPIPESYSAEDIANNLCPDDKLLETLLKNNVPIHSSNLATVKYYLGGISTAKAEGVL